MSTLELIWDAQTTYKFWSWTNGNVHYVARFIRRLPKRPMYAPCVSANVDENAGVAVVKLAFDPAAIEALEHEAQFYNQLKDLQGGAVPRCLGHFRSKVGGRDIACLVVDYCTGIPGEQMHGLNRKIMAAAYAVHASGVMHGDLLDGHHFVKNMRQMTIVDFSAAVQHRCIHGMPMRGSDGHRRVGVCPELAVLENIYGVHRQW
ncbi:hypothetical protein C8J57DRAFT_1557015 [Mycena rebaudengoi]|nr:hypothetical protein C8J57DRAFT_1557015 [Mycena rebaudengoi]